MSVRLVKPTGKESSRALRLGHQPGYPPVLSAQVDLPTISDPSVADDLWVDVASDQMPALNAETLRDAKKERDRRVSLRLAAQEKRPGGDCVIELLGTVARQARLELNELRDSRSDDRLHRLEQLVADLSAVVDATPELAEAHELIAGILESRSDGDADESLLRPRGRALERGGPLVPARGR